MAKVAPGKGFKSEQQLSLSMVFSRDFLLRRENLFPLTALALFVFVPWLAALYAMTVGLPDAWRVSPPGDTPVSEFVAVALYLVAVSAGTVTFLRATGGLSREQRVGTASLAKVAADTENLRRGADEVILTSEELRVDDLLASGTLLQMPVADQTNTYKMLNNLVEDATARRFDPIALVVARVTTRIHNGSQEIRHWQGLALRLGILGTFIGLVLALNEVQQTFGGDTITAGQLAQTGVAGQIGGVIESLALAFGTSIAGLFAAIALQFLGASLRQREGVVIDMLERLAASAQTYCNLRIKVAPVTNDIESLRAAVEASKHQMFQTGEKFGHATERMVGVSDGILGAIGTLNDGMKAANGELTVLMGKQAEAVKAAETATARIAEIEAAVATKATKAIDEATTLQRQALEDLKTHWREHDRMLIEEIRQASDRDALKSMQQQISEALERSTIAIEEASRKQSLDISGYAKSMVVIAGLMLAVSVFNVFGGMSLFSAAPPFPPSVAQAQMSPDKIGLGAAK